MASFKKYLGILEVITDLYIAFSDPSASHRQVELERSAHSWYHKMLAIHRIDMPLLQSCDLSRASHYFFGRGRHGDGPSAF